MQAGSLLVALEARVREVNAILGDTEAFALGGPSDYSVRPVGCEEALRRLMVRYFPTVRRDGKIGLVARDVIPLLREIEQLAGGPDLRFVDAFNSYFEVAGEPHTEFLELYRRVLSTQIRRLKQGNQC